MSPEDFRAAKRPRVEEPADTAADDDAEVKYQGLAYLF